jgi:DNA-directed RNA polymerase specialized sigma24 family protein
MNKAWTLTQTALDSLLAWLDPDRDTAGAKYEAIRLRLIKIFTCRGCAEAEDLADETINRVISKLAEVADSYQGDPSLFFYGVAKRVQQEYERTKFKPAVPLPVAATPDDELEREHECLEKCMQAIAQSQRELVLQYYQEDKRAKINNRKQLAEKLGIAANALRIRACRIRAGLQQCVEACLSQQPSA